MNIILFDKLPSFNLIPLSDDRAKHIIDVLKLKEGDFFKMGIVNESEGKAVVKSISENGIEFLYSEESKPVLYPVTLVVAQVRPICMKRILREAVSLGVGRIVLTGSQTGEKSYLSSNLYKTGEYKDYLLDGAMQSAHAGLPEVIFASNVTGALPLSHAEIKSKAVLAIGPERGWSDYERKLFTEDSFEPMLLGSRVLRTETACSTGIAVLLSRMNYL